MVCKIYCLVPSRSHLQYQVDRLQNRISQAFPRSPYLHAASSCLWVRHHLGNIWGTDPLCLIFLIWPGHLLFFWSTATHHYIPFLNNSHVVQCIYSTLLAVLKFLTSGNTAGGNGLETNLAISRQHGDVMPSTCLVKRCYGIHLLHILNTGNF